MSDLAAHWRARLADDRASTHYEGCTRDHWQCAMHQLLEEREEHIEMLRECRRLLIAPSWLFNDILLASMVTKHLAKKGRDLAARIDIAVGRESGG